MGVKFGLLLYRQTQRMAETKNFSKKMRSKETTWEMYEYV
jgi:hypothetical protein